MNPTGYIHSPDAINPIETELIAARITQDDKDVSLSAKGQISGLYGVGAEISISPQCHRYTVQSESGDGQISVYSVFPGVTVVYNDLHLTYLDSGSPVAPGSMEINHCREGRFECEIAENDIAYLSQGDMGISMAAGRKSLSYFPSGHYHGITILIEQARFTGPLRSILEGLDIDVDAIYRRVGSLASGCYLVQLNASIAHIFSELYTIRDERRDSYLKIKVIELLLFLSDLDMQEASDRAHFSREQVDTVHQIRAFITANFQRHFTLAQLAERFSIHGGVMQQCFKSVYGDTIYAYLKTYRMRQAEILLAEGKYNITQVAEQVGYENSAKFSTAFKRYKGLSPKAYQLQNRNG